MVIRRSPFLYLLSLVFCWGAVSRAVAQTPDDIVEKHIAAIGGRDALARITSRRAVGTVTLSTPNGELAGLVEMDDKAPNKTRQSLQIDLSSRGVAAPVIMEQKFDGTSAWFLSSMQGNSEITGTFVDNMRNSTFPSNLLGYKAAGVTLALLPREQMNGADAIVLRWTPKVGPAVRMYFDATTYLLGRTVVTVNSNQTTGDIEQTMTFSDYRAIDGVKVPFQIVYSTGQTVKFTKIEHNVPFDDALFSAKRPGSDRR